MGLYGFNHGHSILIIADACPRGFKPPGSLSSGCYLKLISHIPPSIPRYISVSESYSFVVRSPQLFPHLISISILAIMGNAGSTVASTAVACNGNLALCSRLYSNVTQIGTHDSAFVGTLPTDNQLISVTHQLDDGVRFLQAQTHVKNGVLELCHTSCIERDAGPLTSECFPDSFLGFFPWINCLPLENFTN